MTKQDTLIAYAATLAKWSDISSKQAERHIDLLGHTLYVDRYSRTARNAVGNAIRHYRTEYAYHAVKAADERGSFAYRRSSWRDGDKTLIAWKSAAELGMGIREFVQRIEAAKHA